MANGTISMDKVVQSTLKGIIKSHKEYMKWSDGEWLWNAPEYFITVKIAEKIAKLEKSKFITMEDNVHYILEHANAKGSGKVHSDIRKDGRFDIVLWSAGGTPRAVIEVKNGVNSYNKIESDIARIKEVLKRKQKDSKIQFGLIAFYISQQYKDSAESKLKKQVDNIYNEAKSSMGTDLKIQQYGQEYISCEDDKNAYCPVVFLIKR